MKWKIILVCFLFLCSFQAVNAQIEESTEEDNSDAFFANTTGDESEGFQAETHGTNSEGFFATTYGRSGEGFYAITHGYSSEGFQAVTHDLYSEGFFSNTNGNQSEGFEAKTYGRSSEGFYATTHGYNSEGFQAETHGRHSEGFFARAYGDESEGVFAYSAKYHGVVGQTSRSIINPPEAYGGLFINPDGYTLAAGSDYDDVTFKVNDYGSVYANGNLYLNADREGDGYINFLKKESGAAGILWSNRDNLFRVSEDWYVVGDITASGTKHFVMEHPHNESKEIVYTSLEGDEAGVYTRGTAQLEDGAAAVQLPEHFELVASGEGLTVQVTPLGNCNGLYVEQKSNQKIVVKELMDGKSDVQFDYYVQGVRTGYEEYEVIRDKN